MDGGGGGGCGDVSGEQFNCLRPVFIILSLRCTVSLSKGYKLLVVNTSKGQLREQMSCAYSGDEDKCHT